MNETTIAVTKPQLSPSKAPNPQPLAPSPLPNIPELSPRSNVFIYEAP